MLVLVKLICTPATTGEGAYVYWALGLARTEIMPGVVVVALQPLASLQEKLTE